MEVPGELVVDMEKESRSLLVTPELERALPDLADGFDYADGRYQQDPEAYLRRMETSVFSVSRNGQEADCSLIYDETGVRAGSVMVMFAPFSDAAPQTSHASMLEYLGKSDPGLGDKQNAKPNTWNQVTKAAVVHDVLKGLGYGMPVITIYSPVPPGIYTGEERKSIRRGDISPVAETARLAIAHAQDILHGPHSETRITDLHTHGASLGDNAIGSAAVIAREGDMRVRSVTAQELILMDGSLVDLADRYMFRQNVGDPSELEIPGGTPRIREPAVRQDIDRHGLEPSAYWRVFKAMTKLSYLIGLTRPEWLSRQVGYLADEGVDVTVANAVNSHISQETSSHLPLGHPNLNYIDIRAVAGQKVGHLADEHVALVAGVIALGVARSLRDQAA
jgi:hypothetical protein